MGFRVYPAGRGFNAPDTGQMGFRRTRARRCQIVRRIPMAGKNAAGDGEQGKVGQEASERFHGYLVFAGRAGHDADTCLTIPHFEPVHHGVFT